MTVSVRKGGCCTKHAKIPKKNPQKNTIQSKQTKQGENPRNETSAPPLPAKKSVPLFLSTQVARHLYKLLLSSLSRYISVTVEGFEVYVWEFYYCPLLPQVLCPYGPTPLEISYGKYVDNKGCQQAPV